MASITEASIRALQPGEKDRFLYEAGGFGVRVTKAGVKYFVVQTRINGQPRRLPLGKVAEMTITEARKRAKLALGQVASGVNPIDERRQERVRGMRLADYWDGYLLRARGHLRPHTVKGYESVMTVHVLPRLGSRAVSDIKRSDAHQMHTDILRRTATEAKPQGNRRTANKAAQVLRLVLSAAENDGVIPIGSNELKGMRLPKDNERRVFLRDDQVEALEKAFAALVGKGVSVMSEAFLRTMLLTGARGGELQALEWTMIDEERQLAILPQGKNGDVRVIPLAGAWDIIAGLPRAGRFVFWGRSPDLPFVMFREAWRRLRTEAGLGSDVKPHDLRHSFASAVLAQNYALPVLGGLLGHRSVASTKRYSHLAATAVNTVAGEAAAAIRAAAKGGVSVGRVRK